MGIFSESATHTLGGVLIPAKTPRSRKNKGRQFENELAQTLREAFPDLDPADISARSMGDIGIDLLLSPIARQAFPFGVEAKRVERLNIYSAIKQAETNAKKEGLHPMVVFRKNHDRAWAAIPLSVLLDIVSKYPRRF